MRRHELVVQGVHLDDGPQQHRHASVLLAGQVLIQVHGLGRQRVTGHEQKVLQPVAVQGCIRLTQLNHADARLVGHDDHGVPLGHQEDGTLAGGAGTGRRCFFSGAGSRRG